MDDAPVKVPVTGGHNCPQCGTTIYQRVAQCMFCKTALTDEAIDATVVAYKARKSAR